jgi:hypothetical protein
MGVFAAKCSWLCCGIFFAHYLPEAGKRQMPVDHAFVTDSLHRLTTD